MSDSSTLNPEDLNLERATNDIPDEQIRIKNQLNKPSRNGESAAAAWLM